jgi:hypothetical protein
MDYIVEGSRYFCERLFWASQPIYGLLVYCKPSFQLFNATNRNQDCSHISGLLVEVFYLRTPDESIRALSPLPSKRFLIERFGLDGL